MGLSKMTPQSLGTYPSLRDWHSLVSLCGVTDISQSSLAAGVVSDAEAAAATVLLQKIIDERAQRDNHLTIPNGMYVFKPPIVLPIAFQLSGESQRGVTLVARSKENDTAALIESKDLAKFVAGGGAQWQVDGLPSEIGISNMTLHGGLIADPDNLFKDVVNWHGGSPATMPGWGGGIDLYSNAPRILGVSLLNFAGTAIRFRRGLTTRTGPRQMYDYQAAYLSGIRILSCFNGVHTGGSDSIIDNLTVGNCRDTGLIAEGAAHNFGAIHCWAMTTGIKITEGRHYFDNLQAENCSTGVLVDSGAGPRTQIANLRLFKNSAYGLHLKQSALVANASIDISASGAVGVRIENAADNTQLKGYIDFAGSATTAIELDGANNVRLDVNSWDASNAGTFLKFFNSPNRGEINCNCGNYATGVNFNGQTGNNNRVYLMTKSVTTPRLNGTPAPGGSNVITVVTGI